MNVSIDKDVCVGCGMCVSLCPDLFEMQDLIAVVRVATVPADQEECAKRAVDDCPVTAIAIS